MRHSIETVFRTIEVSKAHLRRVSFLKIRTDTRKGRHHGAIPREPGEVVDLGPLGPKLKDTKTVAIIKSNRFEAIRLIVRAGTEIPSHEVPGNITLYCLEGRVMLGLTYSTINLNTGEWVYLDGGEAHSVKGIEDSSLLLTVLFGY